VVEIAATGVTLRGFSIRGTGINLDTENTGVRAITGPVVIEDNRLEDILFGLDLRESPGSIVRRNTIGGKTLDIARRGDGLRLWRSNDCLIEDNLIHDGRDAILWYSEGVTLRRNRVVQGRYGLHFMYSHRTTLEDNVLEDNSVGVYLMYSSHIKLVGNTLTRNRGPSGYGLGLKDADDIDVRDNLITANRVGIYIDNSPFSMDSRGLFTRNVIGYNDVGIAVTPAVQRTTVWENAFLENQEQLALLGRGQFQGNEFASGGRGNYWSDYGGYDLRRDGVGDLPYESVNLFENLMDREPKLRFFLYSPAQQAVELAARALPEMQPEPKFADPSPLMSLPPISVRPPQAAGAGLMAALVAGLLGIAGVLGAIAFWPGARVRPRRSSPPLPGVAA
jgi:nitrous oxidase accessory protein